MPSLRGNPTSADAAAVYQDTNANVGDESDNEVESVLSNIINSSANIDDDDSDKSPNTPPPTFDLLYYIAAVATGGIEANQNIQRNSNKRVIPRPTPPSAETNTMDTYLTRSLYTPDVSTSIACELSTTGLEPSLGSISLDSVSPVSSLSSMSSLSSRSSSSNDNYYTGIDWNANQNWWYTSASSSITGSMGSAASTMPARSAGADLLYYQQAKNGEEQKNKKLHGADAHQRPVSNGDAPKQERRHKLSIGSSPFATAAAQQQSNDKNRRERAKPRYRTKSTVSAPSAPVTTV